MNKCKSKVLAYLELAEHIPAQWLQHRHPHTYARVQRPNVQKVLLLTAVCVALLLDNMLYMVIVPIIPDYLRQVGAWHTHRLPPESRPSSASLASATPTSIPSSVLNTLPYAPGDRNVSIVSTSLPSTSLSSSLPSTSPSSSSQINVHNSMQAPPKLWNQKASVKRPLTTAGGRLVYEGEDNAIGILFASKALVQLVVNPFSGTLIDRVGAGRPMLFGLLVMFVSTAVFAAGSSYRILLLARSLQGVGSAFADTGGFALLAGRFSQPQEREQALGLALSFVSFGCLFAPPFGALLYEFFGKELPFVVLSLVCLLDGILVLAILHPDPTTSTSGAADSTNKSEVTHILGPKSSTGTNGNAFPAMHPNQMLCMQQMSALTDECKPVHTPTPVLNELLIQQSRERTNQFRRDSLQVQVDQPNSFPVEMANDWNARVDTNPTSGYTSSDSSPHKVHTMQTLGTYQTHVIAPMDESGAGKCSKQNKQATPIYVLFRDPQIAVCAGALVMANVSLAFLEPTLSIWMVDHLRAQEWQLGMVWLPAFFPYVFGVYSTVRLNHKYPQYKYLVAIGGLLLTGLSCLCLPAVSSYAQLMLPIGSLCFGVAVIDSAVFPTLGYIVDTRYVSVYGSVYAIADISYSLAYAFGPIVAGAIVAWLDFVWLNWIIALLTLGYCPLLLRLRSVQRYERLDSPEVAWK